MEYSGSLHLLALSEPFFFFSLKVKNRHCLLVLKVKKENKDETTRCEDI